MLASSETTSAIELMKKGNYNASPSCHISHIRRSRTGAVLPNSLCTVLLLTYQLKTSALLIKQRPPLSGHCAPPSLIEVNQDARFFLAWCPQHHPDWVRSPAGVLAHHPAVIRFARPHLSVLAPKSNGNTRAQCSPRPANGVQGVLT